MATENVVQPGASAAQGYGAQLGGSGAEPANLGDILERVLDKGLVIAGDIKVNLLDIELLTVKLRLVIASVQTARELGIDWWENDPWLSSNGSDRQQLLAENRRLKRQIAALDPDGAPGELEAPQAGRGSRKRGGQ